MTAVDEGTGRWQSFRRQCLMLLYPMAAAWLVLVGIANWWTGLSGVIGISWAAILCLVPGWLAFLVGARYFGSNSQGVAFLLGMGVRLVTVALAAVFLIDTRPEFTLKSFVVWLLLFYLWALVLETRLAVQQMRTSRD